jgi:hypothetical protein
MYHGEKAAAMNDAFDSYYRPIQPPGIWAAITLEATFPTIGSIAPYE